MQLNDRFAGLCAMSLLVKNLHLRPVEPADVEALSSNHHGELHLLFLLLGLKNVAKVGFRGKTRTP